MQGQQAQPLSADQVVDRVHAVAEAARAVRANIGKVIVGKEGAANLLLIALLSEGHILIEDVPGMGKTVMAHALARSLDCSFARIQGTADLLPSDVTGVSYFNQKRNEFEFRPGPIFASIVLADEINRATPRTQSALLEAMQERQVTVDGQTMPLPHPFMLVATQNPIELEGTFPLPEAQLDRFLLRMRIDYPGADDERAMLYRFQQAQPLETLTPVLTGDALLALLADGAGGAGLRADCQLPAGHRPRHPRASRPRTGRQPTRRARPLPRLPVARGPFGASLRAAR